MKKISINKKYELNFINLTPKEVKAILLALFKEDLTELTPKCKMLAQIIYNENFTLSQKRRMAKKQETQNLELSTMSYPQCEQNEQNEQIPLNNPPKGLIKIINNNNTHTRENYINIFKQHLNESGRVRERSEEEREPYKKALESFFKEYSSMFDQKRRDALIEIIDTIIEAREQVQTQKGLCFKSRVLTLGDIAKLVVDIEEKNIRPILNYLNFPPNPIKNRPYYILSCLINNSETKRGEKFKIKGERT